MAILKRPPEYLIGSNTPEIKEYNFPSGLAGNLATVDFLIKVARERSRHPLVRQLALRILEAAHIESNDYINEAFAIGKFVQQKTRYVRDINGVETIHDPLTMIDMIRKGTAHLDCDDQSLLVATLLLSIGHQPYFRIVKYKPEVKGFQHIYVVVYEKNHDSKKHRIVLDAILKRKPMGTEVNHIEGKEFKI